MNQRLRVLLLVNSLVIGGAERQLVELARGLDQRRFETTVMTLYPGGPLETDLEGTGVRLTSLRRRGKYDFRPLASLAAFLRREKIQVIQPFLTPATFFGMTAALVAGTPVKVVTERCGLRLDPGIGSNVYRQLEDRLTRFAGVVVPNSEAGCRYVTARGIRPAKVKLVYNGVNPGRVSASPAAVAAAAERLGIAPGTPVAGMVASLEAAKDHDTFLRAAALVARERPDARFVVVGDGSLRAALESQAAASGLGGRVVFTGAVAEVAPLIANFSVAVLTSRDHEGCSNFLLEAMGMGRPLVATDVGGNRELVEDGVNGYLAPPGDAPAIAARILDVFDRPEAAERMGLAGRQSFEARFSLDRMVRDYEQIYTQLWEAHQRAGRSGLREAWQ